MESVAYTVYASVYLALSSRIVLTLKGWSDADWGQCPDTGRSTTGYLITLNGAIDWSSRLQASVAMSSCESECFAIAMTVIETECFFSDCEIYAES